MKSWITPEEAMEAIANGTGKGVRIAVLDSGVEVSHPGLDGLQLRDDIAIVQDDGRIKAVPGEGVDLYGHALLSRGSFDRRRRMRKSGVYGCLVKLWPRERRSSWRGRKASNRPRLSHPELQPWLRYP